ncbi:MAG: ABC transporter ATP-binding protein [Deltaproteobacteria bacterium]|nr:ABC transporter ATP-binding protein [Deltaproteobacteria bacterium]MBW1986356.1 ABC transporter ATP-binding protein [Deltaproteobacteria bacterium]MBW2133749.1 ABC transporter ATP-binding protein [Deltaproteobacteria bacterium]
MIRIIDLTRSFNGHAVLDGINLEVPQGEITVIIGKSGVGKSVLLKHIIGLLKPDRGQVLIDGVDITKARGQTLKELKQRFAYLFQGGALFDSLTVFENVAFPLREKTKLSEAEINSRTRERLAQVALTAEVENKFPDELSGGMKKRVALARALIQEPEIILFDEPVTGLDPPMTNTVFHLISKTHQESGYTALIVSHDIPEIFGIADHVAMLHKGRIIAYGSPEDIQRETNPVVQHFIQGEPDFLEE